MTPRPASRAEPIAGCGLHQVRKGHERDLKGSASEFHALTP